MTSIETSLEIVFLSLINLEKNKFIQITLNNNFEDDSLSAILVESISAAESRRLSAVYVHHQVVVQEESEDFRSLTTSIFLMKRLKHAINSVRY